MTPLLRLDQHPSPRRVPRPCPASPFAIGPVAVAVAAAHRAGRRHLVYAVPPGELAEARALQRARGAGFGIVTELTPEDRHNFPEVVASRGA